MNSINIDEKPLQNSLRLVPDTSVIVEGLISKKIESGEIIASEVILHEAVMAELESQANKNRETGFLGLEEVKKIRNLSNKLGFTIVFKGKRPTDFEIKHAKHGEIDSLIRQLAIDESATLFTADKVQALVAESKGLPVLLHEMKEIVPDFSLDKYFDNRTMSIHIRENCKVIAKRGTPVNWEYVNISDDIISRDSVKELSRKIVEDAITSESGFIESDRKGTTIVQHVGNRIVLSRPPFSDGYEITCSRQIVKLEIKDYSFGSEVMSRIGAGVGGILLVGPPGSGKSTLAGAICNFYSGMGKMIKTIESSRDIDVGEEITQVSLQSGSASEVQDYMLLSRPDCIVFDELKTGEDFRLFCDLRLSGIGVVGVMHAAKPSDALSRLIGKTDLNTVASIIDTILFVDNGRVEKSYRISYRKDDRESTANDSASQTVVFTEIETGKIEFKAPYFGNSFVVVDTDEAIKRNL